MAALTMSFDKIFPNRKDRRKSYHGSKSFDRTCRPHGSCPYCKNSRQYSSNKAKQMADAKLVEFLKG